MSAYCVSYARWVDFDRQSNPIPSVLFFYSHLVPLITFHRPSSCHEPDSSTVFHLSSPPATQLFSHLSYVSYYVLHFTLNYSLLTLSWRRSMDWSLYDRDLCHESVNDILDSYLTHTWFIPIFFIYNALFPTWYKLWSLSAPITWDKERAGWLKETYSSGETWFL